MMATGRIVLVRCFTCITCGCRFRRRCVRRSRCDSCQKKHLSDYYKDRGKQKRRRPGPSFCASCGAKMSDAYTNASTCVSCKASNPQLYYWSESQNTWRKRLKPLSTEKQCRFCGGTFNPTIELEVYCTDRCQAERRVRAIRQIGFGWFVCPCGEVFLRTGTERGKQCYSCSRAAFLKSQKMSQMRRRAAIYGLPNEKINPIEVFNDEGWKCYLCGCDCVPHTGKYQSNAASLDHVIPIIKGGWHVRSNVRCCCLHCNSKKREKIPAVS